MEDFGEFTDLIAAISKITNIEFDPLLEDLAICDQEIAKFHNEVNERVAISQVLADKVSHHRQLLEEAMEQNSKLNVEIIQTKHKLKKQKKNVDKLKSLNTTKVNVEVSENDKTRINEDRAILHLVQELTKTRLNETNGAISVNPISMEVNTTDQKSRSKAKNRNQLWESIERSSKHAAEFEKLFFS